MTIEAGMEPRLANSQQTKRDRKEPPLELLPEHSPTANLNLKVWNSMVRG